MLNVRNDWWRRRRRDVRPPQSWNVQPRRRNHERQVDDVALAVLWRSGSGRSGHGEGFRGQDDAEPDRSLYGAGPGSPLQPGDHFCHVSWSGLPVLCGRRGRSEGSSSSVSPRRTPARNSPSACSSSGQGASPVHGGEARDTEFRFLMETCPASDGVRDAKPMNERHDSMRSAKETT